MILKSIKFNDFRPFKGEQIIDFTSDDNNKTVIVVLAQNTCGKTTLVLSFLWCFYGVSKFDRPDDILNNRVLNEMSIGSLQTASVEVNFEHEGTCYFVKRANTYKKAPNGQSILQNQDFIMTFVDENGETKPCGKTLSERKEVLNSIMPEELSGYFFFEGEKSNSITKKDVKKAVKELLGLEVYSNMMKHLHGETSNVSSNSVMGHYQKLINKDSDYKAQAVYDKLDKAKTALNEKKYELTTAEADLVNYEGKLEEIRKKLREAEPTKELQKERDRIETNIKREKNRLDEQYISFFKDFSLRSFNMFVTPLFLSAQKKFDDMDLSDKGIKGIDINAINELLNRQICLCGTHLTPGSVAYDNVAAYADVVPPREIGTYIRDMLDEFEERRQKSSEYVSLFTDEYKNILLSLRNIDALESESSECLEKLKKVEGINITQYEDDERLYKSRINQIQRSISSLNVDIGSLNSRIDLYEKEFNQYKSKSETAKRYELLYAYAEEIYEWVKRTYDKREADLKIELQNKISELFNSIYSGNRKAFIDDKFMLHLKDTNGKELALTGALETITYFSFVGALVQIANDEVEKRSENEEAEQFGEYYPLVLDAAFSHTDDYHTKSVARCLSDCSKQLIFAVMEKDWQYAKDGIESKVAKVYTIEKESEDYSVISLIS